MIYLVLALQRVSTLLLWLQFTTGKLEENSNRYSLDESKAKPLSNGLASEERGLIRILGNGYCIEMLSLLLTLAEKININYKELLTPN